MNTITKDEVKESIDVDDKKGRAFNERQQAISTGAENNARRQFEGYNGKEMVTDADRLAFKETMTRNDFSVGNGDAGGVVDVAPDIYVQYKGRETKYTFPGEDLNFNADLMQEKTNDWMVKSTLKKITDATLTNSLTSGLIFNPTKLDRDPHEIMAEQLNISNEEALSLYHEKVSNGTYIPPEEPKIIELRNDTKN